MTRPDCLLGSPTRSRWRDLTRAFFTLPFSSFYQITLLTYNWCSLLPSFQLVNYWSLTSLLSKPIYIQSSPPAFISLVVDFHPSTKHPHSLIFFLPPKQTYPMTMKRMRDGEHESVSIANCLMLLSRGTDYDSIARVPSRVFECKTCNRQFPSFQALGGHRASHKKPRLMALNGDDPAQLQSSPLKPKTHECSICGLEFAIGQALGGHMRRHRAAASGATQALSETTSSSSPPPPQAPLLKKPNSRRVLCLDLNLTPLENIDLQFQLGKVASMVDCFP